MRKVLIEMLILAVVCFSAVPAFAEDAYEDLQGTYEDTSYFDGGPGSTINTSPSYESPVSDVPDVGEGVAVGYVDDSGDYHDY